MITYEKLIVYTFAGICGVAGFILTYISLGWLGDSLQNLANKKLN